MNWKKGIAVALSAISIMAMVAGCGSNTATNDQKKIGVIQLVEHPSLDAANKGFVDGLASKGYKKDLVLAIATPAAQTMANASHDIPIMGTAITDYVTAKLVQSNEHPGGNVSGTSDMTPVEKEVDLIIALVPNVKRIGAIYTSSEINSQLQVEKMKAYAATKGITVVEATVSNVNDIQQAATNLVNQDVQAIYTPTDNVLASAMANLAQITDAAKIPVFAADEGMTMTGGVATYSVDYYKLGYQTGLMAAKVLSGEAKISDLAIETQKDIKLTVNEERAKKLGITIPEALRKDMK